MIDLFIPLIAILPLAGFAITAVIGRRLGKDAHWIPVAVVVASWALSMIVAFLALTQSAPFDDEATGFGHDVFSSTPGSRPATSSSRPPSSSTP